MAKNGAISTFGLKLIKAVVAAVFIVLCSRWLNASGRGELSVILFWLHLLIMTYEFIGGSPIANLIRTVEVGKIVPAVWLWSLLVGIVGVIGFGLFTDLPWVWILLIYLPLAWLGAQFNYLQVLGKAFLINNLQLALEVLKLLVLVIYYFISPNISVMHVLAVYAVVHWIVYAIGRFILRPFFKIAWAERDKPPKALFHFGFTNQMAGIIQFLIYRLGVILLAYYVSDASAGVFSNVLLIADTTWIFANSFGTIAHMRIIGSASQSFHGRVVGKYTVIAASGTILACLIIAILPSSLYSAVFGPDFSSMRSLSLLAIPGIVALGFSTVMSHYLHAINKFKTIAFCNAIGLLVQLIFHALLLRNMEGGGAALAFSAGLVTSAICLWFFTAKNLGDYLKINWLYEWQAMKKMIKIIFYK